MRNSIANGIGIGMSDTTLGTGVGSGGSTTFISPLTVKGGLPNGDFALQPAFTAATTAADVFIDGTATGSPTNGIYSWGKNKASSGVTSSAFFTTVGGKNCIKISVAGLTTTGLEGISSTRYYPGATLAIGNKSQLIKIVESTVYRLGGLVNIESATSTTGVKVLAKTTWYQADAVTRIGTVDCFSVFSTTTGSWVSPTISNITAPANAAYAVVSYFAANVSGTNNIVFSVAEASFNQVTSITNSSSTPALFYPTMTAVESTDNIDQSQTTIAGTARAFGDNSSRKIFAEQFLPRKKKWTGFVFQKNAGAGTYTGDVTARLYSSSAGDPATILDSVVISNAIFSAYSNLTDIKVVFPERTLTIDGSTTYWWGLESSTVDGSNYTRIVYNSGGGYSDGVAKQSANGITWATTDLSGADFYFKTLYSKNTTNLTVSTATQTVSVTAPTVDGWDNGTVVGFDSPLTLAVGANEIYVGSNGPSTADGTVGPSLQATLAGNYVI